METHTPTPNNTVEALETEFLPGTSVVYAMLGKCNILSTETRVLEGKSIRFYKLEIKKSALSRSNRLEPAIWVPIATAKDQGLRAPMSTTEAEASIKILQSREYFFKANQSWSEVHPHLETVIRHEGGIGLAKVMSFLHVYKHRQVVASTDVNKFQEMVQRLLFKELSETLGEPIKNLEEKVSKGLRSKLLPDH